MNLNRVNLCFLLFIDTVEKTIMPENLVLEKHFYLAKVADGLLFTKHLEEPSWFWKARRQSSLEKR